MVIFSPDLSHAFLQFQLTLMINSYQPRDKLLTLPTSNAFGCPLVVDTIVDSLTSKHPRNLYWLFRKITLTHLFQTNAALEKH